MSHEKYKNWFEEMKSNPLNFKNPKNRIEAAKFCYNLDLKLPQWLIGVSIIILLAVDLNGFAKLGPIFFKVGVGAYVTAFMMILISVYLIGKLANRQKKVMTYLYQELDKKN